MSSNSKLYLRGQDHAVQVVLNNVPISGMIAMDSFAVRPKGEIIETGVLGEARMQFDYRLDGFEGSFTVFEVDNSAFAQVLKAYEDYNDGLADAPTCVLIVRKRYRTAGHPVIIDTYIDCVLSISDTGASGRGEHSKISYEFKARFKK